MSDKEKGGLQPGSLNVVLAETGPKRFTFAELGINDKFIAYPQEACNRRVHEGVRKPYVVFIKLHDGTKRPNSQALCGGGKSHLPPELEVLWVI